MDIGFIGLGTMGLAMASRLLDASVALVVWNRTAERCAPLRARGARVAQDVDEVFRRCPVVVMMLIDEQALDAVLGRGTPEFSRRVHDRLLVNCSTTSPGWSATLAAEVESHGGRYVEAPVSGSRGPAERGELIGMLAGADEPVSAVESLMRPVCRKILRCGPVPSALRLKLAVNHYLIVLVAALAETVAAASRAGVELDSLRAALDEGPMSSEVARVKLAKLGAGDFSPQASIRDVATIAALVHGQAQDHGADAPLIAEAARRYAAARAAGLGELDMVAIYGGAHPAGPAGDR